MSNETALNDRPAEASSGRRSASPVARRRAEGQANEQDPEQAPSKLAGSQRPALASMGKCAERNRFASKLAVALVDYPQLEEFGYSPVAEFSQLSEFGLGASDNLQAASAIGSGRKAGYCAAHYPKP